MQKRPLGALSLCTDRMRPLGRRKAVCSTMKR
nr:MAG TPA: hypothetical protein [Caudoviricetes sp.]